MKNNHVSQRLRSPLLPLAAAAAPISFRRKSIAAAVAALFVLPGAAGAATITVGGTCDVRSAINAANSDTAQAGCPAGSGTDTIVLVASSTLSLGAGTLPSITSPITIQGNGSILERLASAGNFRLLDVTATGNLTLNDLTVRNGQISGNNQGSDVGGGIRSAGRLVLNRSTVTGNRSNSAGGGIGVVSGSFELNDSTVSANYAGRYGGGVYTEAGSGLITTTIRNSTITGNTSGNFGGGLSIEANGDGVRQTIDRSTISGNTAGTTGGGIFSDDSLTITNSTISGNTASLYGGGGIFHRRGTLLLRDTNVADNRAENYGGGGGIATRYGSLELVNSAVSGNRSASYNGGGGGIVHFGGEGAVNLRYSTVSGNFAQTGYGGGINSQAPVTLSNSQVTGNTAYNGAGGIYTAGVRLTVAYSSVSNNMNTYGDGGGVLVTSAGSAAPGSLAMSNSTVSGNRSGFAAGGILVSFDAQAEIQNSTISGNTANGGAGGGVETTRSTVTIRNSTITGNTALSNPSFDGGGIAHGSGLLTLGRNIISGNAAPNGPSGMEISKIVTSGTIVSEGFNVLGTSAFTNAQAFRGFTPVASDRTATSNGTHPTVISNILGAGPAAIGGPTLAFNTRGVSPARDFIPSAMCAGETDQRGVVRPKNGVGGASANECDAGSVESAGFNAVNLSLTKTSNGPVLVGEPLTYTLTLRNDGLEPANGLHILDPLPPGLSLRSVTDNNPDFGECSLLLGTLGCRLQRLGPNESFQVNLATNTSTVGPVTNLAGFSNDTLINTNASGTTFDTAATTQVFGPTVTLSASPASINEAGGSSTLTATLSQVVSIPIVVNLAYSGTATAADSTRPASITIPAGSLSGTATITAIDDTLDEDDETVIASISSVPNGSIGGSGSATVTIVDDDAAPSISFIGTTQTVDEAAGTVTVRMTMSRASSFAVTVPLTFSGTASNPTDYTPSAAVLTIPAGNTSGSITLNVVDDALDEDDETVIVSAGTPVNANFVGPTEQTVTIIDNDITVPPDTLSFNNAVFSVNENAGLATITLTRTGSLAGAVSVDYASSAGTAVTDFVLGTAELVASNVADYTPVSGTLNFAAGQASQSFTIPVTNDSVAEFFENVALTLSNLVGAVLGSMTSARLVIADDDTGSLYFSSVNFATPEGTPAAVLTVFRDGAVSTAATVNYATTNGTALAGSDFISSSGSLSFAAGVSFQTFAVSVRDDTSSEFNERFTASLSAPAGVSLGSPATTTVVILDNDATRIRFSSSTNYVINEGQPTAVITLFREGNLNGTSSVAISTQDGSALAGSDYTANSTTLNFAPGVTTQTFSIPLNNDTLAEATESVRVNLGNVQGAELSGAASSLLYITDNEPSELRFSSAAYVIGEASPTAVLTVYRLGNLAGNSTLAFASSDGTAQMGSDYTPTSGTLSFGPWMATRTISVPIVDNLVKEPIELLNVNLSNANGASLVSPASAVLYIRDND